MGEPWFAVVGDALAAALLTIVFNAVWDDKKQKLAEDWEFRRYHANMIHVATVGIVDAFFPPNGVYVYGRHLRFVASDAKSANGASGRDCFDSRVGLN